MRLWHLGATIFIAGYFAYFLANRTSLGKALRISARRRLTISRSMEPHLSEYHGDHHLVSVRPTPYPDREHIWVARFLAPTDDPTCMFIAVDEFPFGRYPAWRANCEKVEIRLALGVAV